MRDLLFLAHRAPYPPDRGDRIRSYHILRHLAARARVHLIALDEEGLPPPPDLAATLASVTIVRRAKSRPRALLEALATGRPVSLTAFAHPGVREAVTGVRAAHDIAATYVFSGQMAQYVGPDDPDPIVDFVDVDSAKFVEMARSRPPGLIAALLRREARLLSRFERDVSRRAAAALFVSEAEAALFRAGAAVGRIVAVENGVDTALFDPAQVTPEPVDRPTVVFTGQMDYAPNVEAAIRFARDVLPLIRRRHRHTQFAIVGRQPTATVRALASHDVVVTGAVADTRPWLAAASLCVAPLSLARGVQNKVLEAMAMARPVVASPAAAEGIDHGGTLRVAAGDADFAAAVCKLLDDPVAAARLGVAARQRVKERYVWSARLAALDGLLSLDPMDRAAA